MNTSEVIDNLDIEDDLIAEGSDDDLGMDVHFDFESDISGDIIE